MRAVVIFAIILARVVADVAVTFTVDMRASAYPSTSYASVVINFSPAWAGWGATLSDPDGDGIMSATKILPAGSNISYVVAATGNGDSWSGWGQVVPAPVACGANNAYSLTTTAAQDGSNMSVSLCPGECGETCEHVLFVPVTFELDMRAAGYPSSIFTAVTVNHAPSWAGWGLTLADADGDGVMTNKKQFSSNSTIRFKVAASGVGDGWSGWGAVAEAPSECGTNGEYSWSTGFTPLTVRLCPTQCSATCVRPPPVFTLNVSDASELTCAHWATAAGAPGALPSLLCDPNATAAWTECSAAGASGEVGADGAIVAAVAPPIQRPPVEPNLIRPLERTEPVEPDLPRTGRPHPVPPAHYAYAPPYHTNVWWATIGIGAGDGPFTALPYTFASSTSGLTFCAPFLRNTLREAFLSCEGRVTLTLGATGLASMHSVQSHDELSVTMAYHLCQAGNTSCTAEDEGNLTFPLLHGDPYVSALFSGSARPRLAMGSLDSPIVAIDEQFAPASPSTVLRTQAEGHALLRFGNGERWALFWSGQANLTWGQRELTFDAPLDGWLRVAHVPVNATTASGQRSAALCSLRAHSGAVPIGGALGIHRLSERDDDVLIEFNWTTVDLHTGLSEGAAPPLLLTLVHHREHMRQASLLSTDASAAHVESMGSPREGWYLTHRGGLCPYVSVSWTMVLSLRVASSSSRNPNGVAEQDAQGSGAWGFRSTFAGKCRASPHPCGSPEESADHQRASLPPLPCDTPHGRLQHEGRGLLQHA